MKDNRTPLEGFLKYIQGNPQSFSDESDLIKKIKLLINRLDPYFSRNLVVNEINIIGPVQYSDHTVTYFQKVAEVIVENRRPDIAAVDTVCIFSKVINSSSEEIELHDRTYLKWSGQKGYRKTILPNDHDSIAAFAIDYENPGVFLNSAQDIKPRRPIFDNEGKYYLHYKIFAQGFPLHLFEVELILEWKDIDGNKILEATTARIRQ